jgi:hypothetical protein
MIGDLSPQQTGPLCIALKRCKARTPCLLQQTGRVWNGTKLRRIWDDLLPRRGYRIQPRVSTLGNHPNKWFALKGREIEPRYARTRPEPRPYSLVVSHAPSAALSGRAAVGRWSPGLKPRAEPSRPLRGEEASQILLILLTFVTVCLHTLTTFA